MPATPPAAGVVPGGTGWPAETGEKGGVAWNAASLYIPGDVVSFGSILYSCTLATAAGDSDPTVATGSWDTAKASEQGGVAWVTGTVYALGDVVVDTLPATPADWITYACILGHTAGGTFAGDIADWKVVGAPEVGGILWDVGTEYMDGDIVTDDNRMWICVTDNTTGGGSPSTGNSDFIDTTTGVHPNSTNVIWDGSVCQCLIVLTLSCAGLSLAVQ